jgi:hypothetical protein
LEGSEESTAQDDPQFAHPARQGPCVQTPAMQAWTPFQPGFVLHAWHDGPHALRSRFVSRQAPLQLV